MIIDNNKEELVSVIVPIYNTEKHLKKCIESIINQKYKKLEIILVNDGSTDNSLEICKKAEKNDKRIIIINEENRGVSYARNVGIKYSTGKYIAFIDSDDYINEDYICNLVDKSYNLVVCNFNNVYNNVKSNIFHDNIMNNCLNESNYNIFMGPVCKMYSSKILKENKILFNQNMNYGEDIFFNIQFLNHCKNVKIINYSGYNITLRDNSLSRKYVPDSLEQMIKIVNLICSFNKIDDRIKEFWKLRSIKVFLVNESKNKFKVYKKNIKYNEYIIKKIQIKSIYLNKRDKIIYFLFKYKFYGVIYVLFNIMSKS